MSGKRSFQSAQYRILSHLRLAIQFWLLIIFLLFCHSISLHVERANRQRSLVKEIIVMGGQVTYKPGLFSFVKLGRRHENHSVLVDFFATVDSVKLVPSKTYPADKQLQTVAQLPTLNGLEIDVGSTCSIENGVYHVELTVEWCLTDKGLSTIIERLDGLKNLSVVVDNCSDSAVRRLNSSLAQTKIDSRKFSDSVQ